MTLTVMSFIYSLALAALVGAYLGYKEGQHHASEDSFVDGWKACETDAEMRQGQRDQVRAGRADY